MHSDLTGVNCALNSFKGKNWGNWDFHYQIHIYSEQKCYKKATNHFCEVFQAFFVEKYLKLRSEISEIVDLHHFWPQSDLAIKQKFFWRIGAGHYGVPEGLRNILSKFPVHNPRQWRAILKIRLQNGFLASKMLFPPDFFRNYGAELIFDTEFEISTHDCPENHIWYVVSCKLKRILEK